MNALAALGKDVQEYKNEQMPNPKKSFFQFVFDDFTLDLLPEIKASMKFKDAYKNREVVNLKGFDIPFISLADLLKDKEALARPKDINDIENLKNINKDNSLE